MTNKACKRLSLSRYFSFPLALALILSLSACQTIIGPSVEEQKKADILRTQKSLVISFLNKGLPGIALKELRNHIRASPKDADFKNLMGLTLLALKNPHKSIKYFKQARKLSDKISFSLNLGSAYIETQQYKKAIKQLQMIQRHDDYDEYRHPERIIHNIGLASEKLGRIKTAEKFYKRALRANPKFYISLMRLAQIKENKRQHKAARSLFKKAQKVCQVCYDPINGIAMTYIAQRQPKKAILILGRYIKQKAASKKDKKRAKQMISMAAKFSQKRRKF